ncbi:hypothetical protein E2562_033175 [Oryza meyeriana var. granulata]|uniref:Leucine-rich repeat-containing N-terminal plant-type domain-containing protein n=1 Tax=Oryza meyeriana var. granulata TaxID=110450 RepID=A0A6G1DRF7_9ORYZ|nr:hypothetical protein E2562_033175 [Oryza meyeriana var. granulata]
MVAPRRSTASFLFLLVLAVSVSSSASLDRGQERDRSALHQLRDATGLRGRWSPDSGVADHCSWPGVTCDASRRVVALAVSPALARREVAGELPPAVGLLTELRELSFPSCGLRGEIPAEIWRLEKLEVVNLAGNSLHGALPAAFPPRLRVLNLASNLLHGEIQSSLSDCKSLERLNLSGNRFTGSVPGVLGSLTKLKQLDLSRNLLTGRIPSGLGNCRQLRSLQLFSNLLDGSIPPEIGKLRRLQGIISVAPYRPIWVRALTEGDGSPPDGTSADSGGGFSKIEIASITSASAIVAVLLALIILYIYTRKCASRRSRRSLRRREVTVFVDIGAPLTYETVVRATGSFNASNCIGSGGFGATYKAEIAPGVLVAIKRLAIGRFQDKKALDPSFSPYGNGFNIVAWACMLLQKGRAREFFIEGLWDVAPHDDLVEILHLGIKKQWNIRGMKLVILIRAVEDSVGHNCQ